MRVCSTFVALLLLTAAAARGQDSSLMRAPLAPLQQGAPESLPQASFYFTPTPVPKQVALHDLVTIRVDERAALLSEGEVQRRKISNYEAVLEDWVRLVGLKAIKPAPQRDGDPAVSGQLNQQYRADSELETAEQLSFNITARVVDIRPNGNVVLEAHRAIRNNNETWEYSLSGVCRADDIGRGKILLSRDIADLHIYKRERGHVRDGYRRGWFTQWLDTFGPF